jgi:ubiquinol-cytochrome c reductase cytochrome c subunit
VKLLSARRRHPLAHVVVMLFALVAFGGLYALAAPTSEATSQSAQSTQIEEGRKLFAVSCSTCHGPNAEGTVDGPSLIGVGAASVDFQVGTGRMPAQQPGPQMPGKPTSFSNEEIEALAAYVASLGPGPQIPVAEEYATEELSDAELAEGGELFRTNCASCHNVVGKGGALPDGRSAPSLDHTEPRHMFEAMVTGPQQMPVFSDKVIEPEEKKKIIGYLEEVREQPSTGGLALGSLGPVSEGLFAWLVGIGGLVIAAVWIAAKGAKVKR